MKSSPRACRKQDQIVRPSLKPQRIDADAWYYEYRGRIDVVVYINTGSGIPASRCVKIPWRTLERSMRRCRLNTVRTGHGTAAGPGYGSATCSALNHPKEK